jgi:hypothetical protein
MFVVAWPPIGASTIWLGILGWWRRPTWWSCTGWCAATPDYARLLGAAADHARRGLVFSYPPRNPLSRAFYAVFNLVMRLTRSSFRGFAHPPGAMLGVLEDRGLRRTFQHRSRIWQVAGLERVS